MNDVSNLPESDDELLAYLGRVIDPELPPVDDSRVAAIREAARAHAAPVAKAHPRRRTPLLVAAAAGAALVVGVAIGLVVGGDGDDKPGTLEYAGALIGPDGVDQGDLEVRLTGIGRIVDIDTDLLPILPVGEFYEVWFVAPTEGAGEPARISAGTFHPDEDGRSVVRMTAAVDPTLFPVLEITAEPDPDDPTSSGLVVLRADLVP